MPIRSDLAVMMAKRRISGNELAERSSVTHSDIMRFRQEDFRALRISTVEKLCEALDCQPGDLLRYERSE